MDSTRTPKYNWLLMRVQDCAVVRHAPRMLTPDTIRSEVVASSGGRALAIEPEERRVPVTLVPAAACDADFSVGEWRPCIGDQLKVRVFDEIHVHPTDANELISQSSP